MCIRDRVSTQSTWEHNLFLLKKSQKKQTMDDTKIVDKLLKAEEDANNKIKEAQRVRENKIKEAKIAADQEIQSYRKEEQEKYEGKISNIAGDKQELDQNEAAEVEIKKIHHDFDQKKHKVIDMLIDRIMEVNLQIPLVLKEQFE
eukprot:TRINITY_DN2049_c0_g1_i8.p2 TRINITY_DN2049_c0_g1~~TRINITY_DN2049_c0_g1_i8.p2  ORF type:complete len:145 (+),score=49.25 TRINITY_DN2049_c0_g1_i8:155-589(+)